MTDSHILIHHFDYHEPATLDEAVSLLARYDGRASVLAGGTDLLVQMKMERTAPDALVGIGRIPGLDGIASQPDGLHIGARATIAAIERDPAVGAEYQALAEACASFSTTQVQTMGTLGGNLANGSPASDTAPALLAFGAELELVGLEGPRRLPLEEFFLGPGKTALRPAEVISAVILPRPRAGTGSAFLKIGRVAADIAKASVAVALVRQGDRIAECRIACGSVAPTPVRALRAEGALIGRAWDDALAREAAEIAAKEISPIDDVRSSAWYRRQVVAALAYDGLTLAWQRAGRASPEEGQSGNGEKGKRGSGETGDPLPLDPFIRSYPLHPAPMPFLAAAEKRMIELTVNGQRHSVWVSPNDLLLNVLRDQLQLTGTKYGCGIGECSACTVQLDGAPVLACLVLAVSAVGRQILTIEGLAGPGGELDPLQDAFIEFAAYQCGYCTPGMLLTAKSLLAETPRPSEEDVRHYLRGNLCRCTGYASIVRAVLACSEATAVP